jgi:hypothetical protein
VTESNPPTPPAQSVPPEDSQQSTEDQAAHDGPTAAVVPRQTVPTSWYSRMVLRMLRRLGADPDKYEPDGSRWPSSKQQFLWDLAPSELAPNRDGLNPPPHLETPSWALGLHEDDKDEIERLYQAARTFRRDADESTRNLELKAARLATVLVALLTANVALVVFEITRLGPNPSLARIGIVAIAVSLGVAALAWLVVGLTRAVDADQRMGITAYASLERVATDKRAALVDEAEGFRISNWTRGKKADRLLDARAAVSRSMVCLVASAALALVLSLVAATSNDDSGDDNDSGRYGPQPTQEQRHRHGGESERPREPEKGPSQR